MSLDAIDADARAEVVTFLFGIADDEFLTGQALTEWLAVAPTMEEDNALSEIAQDELGHARMWYELLEDDAAENADTLEAVGLPAADVDLDGLAIGRPPEARRNSLLVEADRGDFEVAVAINYLYDEAEARLLDALAAGDVDEIADRAAQAASEESFHREHAERWLDRLATTEEGQERLAAALESVLPRAADYFAFDDAVAAALEDQGVLATSLDDLEADWQEAVRERLAGLPIEVDTSALEGDSLPSLMQSTPQNGRAGDHTEDLTDLLARAYPDDAVDHGIPRAVQP